MKIDNSETNNALVCAAKMYSHLKKEFVWVVSQYPFVDDVESEYWLTKRHLGLSRRKSKWKLWPTPFASPDGKEFVMLAHEIQNDAPSTCHRKALAKAARRLESTVGAA